MGPSTDDLLTPPWEQDARGVTAADREQGVEFDFFISYAGEDLEIARRIADDLHAQGHAIRFQQHDFGVGQKFHRQIDDALLKARRVIAVVSEASLKSKWCRDEWDAAGDKLLPLRIERTELAGVNGLRTWVDLFGPGMDDEATFRAVLLEAVAGRQPANLKREELGANIDLPRRRPALNGRESLLKEIFSRLVGRESVAPHRLTLTGMGGIGKTAVACEYGHRIRDREANTHVWFVRAEQAAVLEDQLRVLVNGFQVPRKDLPLAEQVRRVLERQSGWLLILDQAPDLASVVDYLPPTADGHVLITSENTVSWGAANVLEIAGWRRDDAVTFLLEETGSQDRSTAEALADEFDCHPESLIQAASYIDRTGITITSYLARYRDQRDQDAEEGLASLAVAIDDLESKPLAVAALRIAAFFAPDQIPIDLLVRSLVANGRQVDDRDFDLEVAEPLRRFSLIRRDDRSLTVSRLVQRQLRASAVARGDSSVWLAAALAALDDVFPHLDELAYPDVWLRAAELLPHLLTATEHARSARLELALVGRLLTRAGRYLTTAEYEKDPVITRVPSRSHGATAPTIHDGAAPSALNLLADARRALEEAHGGDHLDVAEVVAALGDLWRSRGSLPEAMPFLRDAYAITVRTAGPESLDAGLRLVQLARAERDGGSVSTAVEQLERALATAEAAGTAGQPLRSEALASLGIAMTRQGRFTAAVAGLRASIEVQEQLWGSHHIEVALTLDALGDALAGYGDARAAVDAYDRKLGIEHAVYGEQSRHRSFGLAGAALNAIEAYDVERANELATEMLALVGETPVHNDDTVSLARQVLARSDRLRGRGGWRDLLSAAGRALVDAGLPDVVPRLLLVDYLVEDGSTREGAELAASVARERVEGADWVNATDAVVTEAWARTEGGELSAAKDALIGLIDALEQRPVVNESLLIYARLSLGRLLLSVPAAAEEACACFEVAYRLAESLGYVGQQAEAAMGRGESLLLEDQHEESVDAFREALALRASNMAPGHPLVVDAQLALARAEGAGGNDAEARRLLNEAVALTATRAGARSVDVATTYVDVADTLVTLRRISEATGRLDEALLILEQVDDDGREVLAAKSAIGSVLLAAGERGRALELATSVYTAAAADAPAGRALRANAAQLLLGVAVLDKDVDEARRIVRDLERELGNDPGVLPRLRADCWLELADVVADAHEALAAVRRARTLAPDPLSPTHDAMVLREAELSVQLGEDEHAFELAEDLLARASAAPFRLDVLRVAAFTALNTERGERAAEHVRAAAALVERDDDALRRASHRIWIASIQDQRGAEAAAHELYRDAARDLRDVDHGGQPERVGAAIHLFGTLAYALSQFGDHDDAANMVEEAIEAYRRALGDVTGDQHADGDGSSTSSFQLALMRASSLTDERVAGPDPLTTAPMDDADAWQQVLIELVDVIGAAALDDETFDRLADWMQGPGERGSSVFEQIALLATLADRRGFWGGWDDAALKLLTAAESRLNAADAPPASLRARLALLRAAACLDSDDDASAAIEVLAGAADALAFDNEAAASADVLIRLAELHAESDDPQAAARRFGEAGRLLDTLRRPLGDRLELATKIALAHLRANNRPAAIAGLRHAVAQVNDEEPPVDVGTIYAMVNLASVLANDVIDDRGRAEEVLEAAAAVHDAMLDSNPPRADALADLTAAVLSVRGPDAALSLIASAIDKLGDPSTTSSAMVALAREGVSASLLLDTFWSLRDPAVRVEAICTLASVLDFQDRVDDARAVLSSSLERVRAAEIPTPSLEIDLLIALSDVESGPPDAIRAWLEQARAVAVAHVELEDRAGEVEERLAELEHVPPLQDDIDALSQLAARYPDNPWLHSDLARAEFAAGRYQAALDSVGQALAVAGREPSLLAMCAEFCNGIAEYEAAADYARAAIELDASDPAARYSLAWALQHLGASRGEECEAAFEQVLAITDDRSTHLYALKGRAGARRILGREEESLADYETVLNSLEAGDDPWLEGWVRYNLGDHDGARLALQQALAADGDRLAAQFDLALVAAVAGMPEATEEYRAVLDAVEERQPRARLAPLRVAQNDLRDAATVHQRLRTDPTFRAIVDQVEANLEATESVVVHPILPAIPPPS